MQPTGSINWFDLAITAPGGLALFLYGLELLSGALKAVAGLRLKRYIAKAVGTPLRALLTGIGVTAVMQSSSMTTTLLIGFVGAGLMSLRQSIPVLMGAEIGTTVTAQLIAFKISAAALGLVFAGWLTTAVSRRQRHQLWGKAVMGLGLLFFGMQLLSSGVSQLRHFDPLLRLLQGDNLLFAILAGMLFTALIQSSTAFVGIVIAMASQGLMDLPTGIALSFGANIGTCITGVIASSSQPGAARQVSAAQVVFNVLGVMIFAPFIHPYSEFIAQISPAAPQLSGSERIAAELPRQLANAHSIFNLSMGLLCVGLAGPLAILVARIVPPRRVEETLLITPRYLSNAMLNDPSSAQEMVRLELGRLGRRVVALFEALPQILHAGEAELREQTRRCEEVDVLYEQVLQYLGRISLSPMSEVQRTEFLGLMKAAGALQHIGSIVRRHFIPLGEEYVEGRLADGDELLEDMQQAHAKVLASLRLSLSALADDEEDEARRAIALEEEINRQLTQMQLSQAHELNGRDQSMRLYARKMVLLENFKRIEYYSRRISRSVLLVDD